MFILVLFVLAVKNEATGPPKYVDPAMIGVLVGMTLMFIILCVVLRLFSK
jgi:glycerol uptake facilitator-like aquaporin